jgi:hypothetical protein
LAPYLFDESASHRVSEGVSRQTGRKSRTGNLTQYVHWTDKLGGVTKGLVLRIDDDLRHNWNGDRALASHGLGQDVADLSDGFGAEYIKGSCRTFQGEFTNLGSVSC